MSADKFFLDYHPATRLVVVHFTDVAEHPIAYRYTDGTTIETVHLELWGVKRFTPCGFVVDDYSDKGKFVLNNNTKGKRWAYLNKDDALDSYIKRKQWQIHHAKHTLKLSQQYLEFAEALRNGSVSAHC